MVSDSEVATLPQGKNNVLPTLSMLCFASTEGTWSHVFGWSLLGSGRFILMDPSGFG